MKVFIFQINANEITNAKDGEKRSPYCYVSCLLNTEIKSFIHK